MNSLSKSCAELPLTAGTIGSLVWALTSSRLILVHASAVPLYLPVPRIRELQRIGWNDAEIGRMYDCTADAVRRAVR